MGAAWMLRLITPLRHRPRIMVSWLPRKLGQRLKTPSLKDEVEALHQERVHLDPLGEGQLAQLIVNGRRQIDGLLDCRRLCGGRSEALAAARQARNRASPRR